MKNLKLIIQIALALMLARWKQTAVAAIGVAFSITMFVTLLGFMNGLNQLLDGLILNRSPHVRLFNEIRPTSPQPVALVKEWQDHYHFIRSLKPGAGRSAIYNVEAVINALKQDTRVLGIAPKMTAQVFYTVGTIDISGVINGVDVDAERALFHFSDYVSKGSIEDLKNLPNSIILGQGVADQMLAETGDIIQVTSIQGQQELLKVVGFFQSGLRDIDKVQSYTSLKTAQQLTGRSESYITDLQLKLYDLDMAPAIAREFENRFELDAEDIQTVNAQFETGSFVRTIISYAVGITLLIVSGFGIYNILNMLIYEKMDSIAILKATGFSGQDVKQIFLTISLIIGVVGALLGIGAGLGLSSLIDQVPFNTAALPNIKTYPIDYNIKYYMIGLGFAIFTTLLGGLVPGEKSQRHRPG